jgi:hypothetical protein
MVVVVRGTLFRIPSRESGNQFNFMNFSILARIFAFVNIDWNPLPIVRRMTLRGVAPRCDSECCRGDEQSACLDLPESNNYFCNVRYQNAGQQPECSFQNIEAILGKLHNCNNSARQLRLKKSDRTETALAIPIIESRTRSG